MTSCDMFIDRLVQSYSHHSARGRDNMSTPIVPLKTLVYVAECLQSQRYLATLSSLTSTSRDIYFAITPILYRSYKVFAEQALSSARGIWQ